MIEDPFVDFVGSRVVEADSRHAVAEQRPGASLDNHAGTRHAGALFNVGYAASRALIEAALGEDAASAQTHLFESEIVFEKVVTDDLVVATAEPAAEGWTDLLRRLSSERATLLPTAVTLRGNEGQVVTSMSIAWSVRLAQRDVRPGPVRAPSN